VELNHLLVHLPLIHTRIYFLPHNFKLLVLFVFFDCSVFGFEEVLRESMLPALILILVLELELFFLAFFSFLFPQLLQLL